MTYEHRLGGAPASPDIDDGLPEVCEICDRDCSEPCEAFKRLIAAEAHMKTWRSGHSDWQMGYMSRWKKKMGEILEGF